LLLKEDLQRFEDRRFTNVAASDKGCQVIKLNAYFLCITAKIFNCHTFQSHVFSLLMKQLS